MAAGVTIDQPNATTPTMRPSRPCRGCMASSLPVLNGVAGLAITSEDWRVLYRNPSLSTTVAHDPFRLLALHDLLPSAVCCSGRPAIFGPPRSGRVVH